MVQIRITKSTEFTLDEVMLNELWEYSLKDVLEMNGVDWELVQITQF